MRSKVLTFWLGVSDKKAAALCKGNAVWTMADLEAAEGMGIDLSEMVTRCATRLKQEYRLSTVHVLCQDGRTRS